MEIIGNEKAVKLLDRIVATGKVSGAYLFIGPEGVGKLDAAKEFAGRLVDLTSSPQVGPKSSINPDLFIIEPEIEVKKGVTKKLDIKIGSMRELQRKMGLTGAGFKAAIINEAEKMTRSAQNAILKTLEEPNDKTVIILVSSNADKILPTILSRCQKIRFSLVPDGIIRKRLPDTMDMQDIIFWSLGRPRIAKMMASDRAELSRRQGLTSELKAVLSGNIAEKFRLAEDWSKDREMVRKKLDLWVAIFREDMLGKPGAGVSPEKALLSIEAIASVLGTLRDTNANARLVLENLFLKL